MNEFELHLTDEQYHEFAQLWREYTLLGPKRGQETHNVAAVALDFCEWIDSDADEEPRYGLPEIEAFLVEKERRGGTALDF